MPVVLSRQAGWSPSAGHRLIIDRADGHHCRTRIRLRALASTVSVTLGCSWRAPARTLCTPRARQAAPPPAILGDTARQRLNALNALL